MALLISTPLLDEKPSEIKELCFSFLVSDHLNNISKRVFANPKIHDFLQNLNVSSTVLHIQGKGK